MKVKNVLLALLLTLTPTFGLALIYTFYPLIVVVLREMFSDQGNGGIAVVAGGVSTKLLLSLFVFEPFLFLLTYSLLQRAGARR